MSWWLPYQECSERGARVRAELDCGCEYCRIVGRLKADAIRAGAVPSRPRRGLHPSPSFSRPWASTVTRVSGVADADPTQAGTPQET